MNLYLPEEWIEDKKRRAEAEIPEEIEFRTKGDIALDQLDLILADGFHISCVVADADYGDRFEFRSGIAKRGLYYAAGLRPMTVVHPEKPRTIHGDPPGGTGRRGRPKTTRADNNAKRPISVKEFEKRLSKQEWRTFKWKNTPEGEELSAECAVVRVTPGGRRRPSIVQEECWLIIEHRSDGTRYYFSNLPEDTNAAEIVRIIHCRWPIEQSYRHLKNELGFDHFAGRKWEGWCHHAVLTVVAYTFLELERHRGTDEAIMPPFPALRTFVRRVFLALHVATNEETYSLVVDFHRRPPLRI